MAREENVMMQERKVTAARARALRKPKKKEWNSVHRRQEEAHRQITAQTLMQGSARKAGHASLEASRRPLQRWVHIAVFSSMIYLMKQEAQSPAENGDDEAGLGGLRGERWV